MMFLSINTATDICSVSVYNENKFIIKGDADDATGVSQEAIQF